MASLGFAESFAKYGATLKNVNWSVSALAQDGSLVVSLWSHHFKKAAPGTLLCIGRTSRWSNHGRDEFCKLMSEAFSSKRPIRVVIATTPFPDKVEAGEDCSELPKAFTIRPDLIGEVVKFDGNDFEVIFRKAK